MEKEEHRLMENKTIERVTPTRKSKVLYILSLSFTTIVLIGVFVVSGLSNYPDPEKVGFKNRTGEISDEFFTHITPSGWAFSIWGIIYAWQALWVLYAWSFVIRSNFPIVISPTTLILYGCANVCNVIWIYVWGNAYPEYAFPFIVILGVFLYTAIGFEASILYKQTARLESLQKFKVDLYLVRGLVLNGIVIYATWVTIATLINFTIVLQYYADLSGADAATIGLTLLTVEVIAYFSLENTVLDRFARPVVMVYPVVIWALSAVIDNHWGEEGEKRTNIFTLILLILAVLLFIVRIVLLIVFGFVRHIKYPNKFYAFV